YQYPHWLRFADFEALVGPILAEEASKIPFPRPSPGIRTRKASYFAGRFLALASDGQVHEKGSSRSFQKSLPLYKIRCPTGDYRFQLYVVFEARRKYYQPISSRPPDRVLLAAAMAKR